MKLSYVYGFDPDIATTLKRVEVHTVKDLAQVQDIRDLSERSQIPFEALLSWQELARRKTTGTVRSRSIIAFSIVLSLSSCIALAAWSYRFSEAARAYNRANATNLTGDYSKAISEYQRTIELKPRFSEAHNNLGSALVSAGDLEGALKEFRQAARLKSNSYVPLYNLGTVLLYIEIAKGKKDVLDEAIVELRAATQLNPSLYEARFNLGSALLERNRQGDLDRAAGIFEQIIAERPDLAGAHANLGQARQGKGDLGGAIAAYRQAVVLSPGSPSFYLALGTTLFLRGRDGDLADAIAETREAIRLNPNFTQAHYNLGVELGKSGDIDNAMSEYRTVILQSPNAVAAHINLGVALQSKGDIDAAAREYEKALAVNPNVEVAHSNIGAIYLMKDQYDNAINEFKRALAINPSYEPAKRGLASAESEKTKPH